MKCEVEWVYSTFDDLQSTKLDSLTEKERSKAKILSRPGIEVIICSTPPSHARGKRSIFSPQPFLSDTMVVNRATPHTTAKRHTPYKAAKFVVSLHNLGKFPSCKLLKESD